MKNVRVISGVYGWADPETGRRAAKTGRDGVFEETDVKAARFVKTGVLAYAEDGTTPAPAGDDGVGAGFKPALFGKGGSIENRAGLKPAPTGGDGTTTGRTYDAGMKFNELKKIAVEGLGVDVPFGINKAKLLVLMDEAAAGTADGAFPVRARTLESNTTGEARLHGGTTPAHSRHPSTEGNLDGGDEDEDEDGDDGELPPILGSLFEQ
jgi:hypothetical protein